MICNVKQQVNELKAVSGAQSVQASLEQAGGISYGADLIEKEADQF